jgi:hypothetical protein
LPVCAASSAAIRFKASGKSLECIAILTIESSKNEILERIRLGWFLAVFLIHQCGEDLLNPAVEASLTSL